MLFYNKFFRNKFFPFMIRSYYNNTGIIIILAFWLSLAPLFCKRCTGITVVMSSNCSVKKEKVFLPFVSEHKTLNLCEDHCVIEYLSCVAFIFWVWVIFFIKALTYFPQFHKEFVLFPCLHPFSLF